MAAKRKSAARRAGKVCVVFRKTAKKGGRRIAPKTVCFSKKAATPGEKKAKAARGRRILKAHACKASGAPRKACRALAR